MLKGKELAEARKQLQAEYEKADKLLTGINGTNIIERMNTRSAIMLRIEVLKRKIYRSADYPVKQMDYNITPASRINY